MTSTPLLYIVYFIFQAYSSPKDDPGLSAQEKRLIMGGSVSKEPVSNIPWKLILSKAPVWALIISHFCHNWGTFILLTWMPTYYSQVCLILLSGAILLGVNSFLCISSSWKMENKRINKTLFFVFVQVGYYLIHAPFPGD